MAAADSSYSAEEALIQGCRAGAVRGESVGGDRLGGQDFDERDAAQGP